MRRSFFSVTAADRLGEGRMARGVRLLELGAQLRQVASCKLGDRDAAPARCAPNQRRVHQLQHRPLAKERTSGIEPVPHLEKQASQ